jgi:hypothetical protein
MCPVAEAGRGAVGEKKADQRGEQKQLNCQIDSE